MSYLSLKVIHILSMVLLFGTGLGSAWYKWMADRSRNVCHISVTNKQVVLADWIFTTPTVIIQPVTGIALLYVLDIPFSTPWVMWSLVLYAIAGLCWIPVVWLQIKMRNISQESCQDNLPLNETYWRYARIWFWLGAPAFISMIVIVMLMVFKFG
ncbi:MAG: DUF2269 domain-containing protein [Gammaproteobacteria bacterium]|nr:DUF2269 domain-containing protein [Gammaproteobacteria bacterium]MDH5661061.1 DUF2269 domain-containing protein [Gammaproteobacteria bacterium]